MTLYHNSEDIQFPVLDLAAFFPFYTAAKDIQFSMYLQKKLN